MLTVAIVEDDAGIRQSLVDLLSGHEEMECIADYGSVEEALRGLAARQPDVMLMDIGLPGISGIEGTAEIKKRWPSIHIMMQTVYDDDEKIFDSICAGASGYILKNATGEEILRAVSDIRGGAPMSPAIARRVLDLVRNLPTGMPKDRAPTAGETQLTPRELEILHHLVDGFSYKKIADALFISPHTVHEHIKHIYEKLHVNSKSAAVSKALKQNLLKR